MSNKRNTVLYVGATAYLERRVFQHKVKFFNGFTTRYNCIKLVYFEEYISIAKARQRETQLGSLDRSGKSNLVTNSNPEWVDLSRKWAFAFD